MIEDAALPILSDLSGATLSRLSGFADTSLLRLRYRPGKRAILHVTSPAGEGALWAFAGDKGRRVARRHPASVLDDRTGTVFDPFPHDHRLPEIAAFTRAWPGCAPDLIGSEAAGDLQRLRYRPGLSCTFRTQGSDGRRYFIKVIGDDDVKALARTNADLCRSLTGTRLRIAGVLGTVPSLRAIAYEAAEGAPLDALLQGPAADQAMTAALSALDTLHALPARTCRQKEALALLATARAARDMVVTIYPGLADLADTALARLRTVPPLPLCQIHGDMKLEHAFVQADRVTLIDTETMAIGPAAYDRAMLDGRLMLAVQEGMPAAAANRARAAIRQRQDPAFDWCRAVVALRLAKYHAQHPGSGTEARAADLLRSLP